MADPYHSIVQWFTQKYGCAPFLFNSRSSTRSGSAATPNMLAAKSFAGHKVASRPTRGAAVVVRADSGRRELLSFGAAALLVSLTAANPAKAGLVEDLVAKSEANKALNDKKRLATSSANLARSRTVNDGTCSFPNNFFGCENAASRYTGGVKYIAEDYALECEGKENTKCASRMQVKF